MSKPVRLETKAQRAARAANYKETAAWVYIGGCGVITLAMLVSPWFFILQAIVWIAAYLLVQTADVIKEKVPASQVDAYEASWWLDKKLPAPGETHGDPVWANAERSLGDAKAQQRQRASNARYKFLQEEEPDVAKLEKELSIAFGLEKPPPEETIRETYKVPPSYVLGSAGWQPVTNKIPSYRSKYDQALKYSRFINPPPLPQSHAKLKPYVNCDCEMCKYNENIGLP